MKNLAISDCRTTAVSHVSIFYLTLYVIATPGHDDDILEQRGDFQVNIYME